MMEQHRRKQDGSKKKTYQAPKETENISGSERDRRDVAERQPAANGNLSAGVPLLNPERFIALFVILLLL